MAQKFEARMIVQVINIALGAGEQVIGAQHLVPLLQQAIYKVRTEKPRPACHQDALAAVVHPEHVYVTLTVPAAWP